MSSIDFSWQSQNRLRIFAREWRPEKEPVGVVGLVHGLGEHIGRYQHVASALNQGGYGVVAFDLPGHGQSEGPRGHTSYGEIAHEINRLLEESARRYPGKPRFLYGHSLGGALVIYFSLKCRPAIHGVIATSPGLATAFTVPAAKILLAKIMSRVAPSFTMENGLDLTKLSRDPDVVQAYRNDPLVHARISTRLGLDLLTLGAWMQAHASEFPVPLLVEQGSQDHLVSLQKTTEFVQAVPSDKVTFKIWEGLYHETHNETEKDQVLQYMVDWLSRHI